MFIKIQNANTYEDVLVYFIFLNLHKTLIRYYYAFCNLENTKYKKKK